MALEIIDDGTGMTGNKVSQLPLGLQGWRLSLVTNHILPVLFSHKAHIQEAMGLQHPKHA